VQSAAVGYVSGRADPLSAGFGFLGSFFAPPRFDIFGNAQTVLFQLTRRSTNISPFLKTRKIGKADLMQMRLASRIGPTNWSIQKRYIRLLDETSSTGAAINELLTCLQSQWYRADSWKLLSELHAKLGDSGQAVQTFAQARANDAHLSASN
jgi:hypothetical protein